jgi:hypothetical protein
VKASLVVVLVLGGILMLILARRRLWLALKLTAGAFVALNLVRFFQQRGDTERFLTFGLAIGAFALCWAVLWTVTRLVERHRTLHPPTPRPAQRRTRWKL